MAFKREKSANREQWNIAADSWSDFVENKKDSGKMVIVPAIMKLLPDKTRRAEKALDLCCGEGYYARILREKGYRVSGVDSSEKMIENARKKSRGIEFRCADAAEMDFLPDGSFDLVLCLMGLIDTPDLVGTLGEIQRVLKDDGYFITGIVHPCFDRLMTGAWERDAEGRKLYFKIDNYMKEGPWTIDWNMKKLKYPFKTRSYHRTLSTYMNALIANNLLIDQVVEPCIMDNGEIDEEECRAPNFLIFRCIKRAHG
jgi:ubiquinone/menaquinone biosynthesis C-methylase UbiE